MKIPIIPNAAATSVALPATTSTRREFCTHACQAAALGAFGVIVSACGGGSPTGPSSNAQSLSLVPATVTGRTISVAVGSTGPLASVGGLAAVQTQLGIFLLARVGTDTFNALTSDCTHQACTVSGYSGSQFVCPCHGSRYNADGTVATGPAPASLRSYATTFANGTLTFSV